MLHMQQNCCIICSGPSSGTKRSGLAENATGARDSLEQTEPVSMRYIGSKTSTLPWLTAFVAKHAPDARSLCDPFAGTCTVARAFKRAGFRVVTGDVLDLSHAIQVATVGLNAVPAFSRLKRSVS